MFPFRGLPVLLLLVCFLPPSAAQVDRATLNGTVTDSSGAVITNAKVEATSAATALRRELQTSANGAYLMPGLPIGRYTVTFSHEGFKTVRYTDVELSVGQSRHPVPWAAVSIAPDAAKSHHPVDMGRNGTGSCHPIRRKPSDRR